MMNNNIHLNVIALIRERLATLQPSFLEIIDDSARHRGHPGAASGAGHYQLKISSARFTANLVRDHRMIYKTLDDLIPSVIHALNIEII